MVNMARTMLIHADLHSPDETISMDLWPMAMDHAVWLYNRIPRQKMVLLQLKYGLEQLFILMTQYLETVILGDVQHLFLSPNFRSLELRFQSGNHVVGKDSTWGLAKCTLHLLV